MNKPNIKGCLKIQCSNCYADEFCTLRQPLYVHPDDGGKIEILDLKDGGYVIQATDGEDYTVRVIIGKLGLVELGKALLAIGEAAA